MPISQSQKDALVAKGQAIVAKAGEQQMQANDLLAQINAIVVDAAPLPWWQTLKLPALKATAIPNKVLTFRHADGMPIVPNPRNTPIGYSVDIFAVNAPAALLLVTDPASNLGWWVAAGDLAPA